MSNFLFIAIPLLVMLAASKLLQLAWPQEAEAPKKARKTAGDIESAESSLVDAHATARRNARQDERVRAVDIPEDVPASFVIPEEFNPAEFRTERD